MIKSRSRRLLLGAGVKDSDLLVTTTSSVWPVAVVALVAVVVRPPVTRLTWVNINTTSSFLQVNV